MISIATSASVLSNRYHRPPHGQWCARMVVTLKKNSNPRRTIDLQKLNNATKREMHHTPSPFDVASIVPTKTRKLVLDAWNDYHSRPLNETTKKAMTLITEWGRYHYGRAPMSFHVSGDAFTRRFDDITAGYPRVVRIIDDSLLWELVLACLLLSSTGTSFNSLK